MNNPQQNAELTQKELLKERLKGKLPVIDIVGYTFYVDVRMETLRPHDVFHTTGIAFSSFDHHSISDDFAWSPYDPKKHEVKNVDILSLQEIPNDWMLIEIAHPWKLDPYGYARDHGYNMEEHLKENPIQANLKARVVNWNETAIPELIKETLSKQSSTLLPRG